MAAEMSAISHAGTGNGSDSAGGFGSLDDESALDPHLNFVDGECVGLPVDVHHPLPAPLRRSQFGVTSNPNRKPVALPGVCDEADDLGHVGGFGFAASGSAWCGRLQDSLGSFARASQSS